MLSSATEAWNSISNLAELCTSPAKTRDEFKTECQSGRLDSVVAICDRAPSSMEVTGKFDKELIQVLPKSLRFLCHMGAGYDSIDVAACTDHRILVSNVPFVVEDASADTAMFLILAALRGFNNGILAIRNGTWKGKTPPPPLGRTPQGKVLGILGMGGIGRNLKPKAEAFGMRVIYHNRKPLGEEMAAGAEYVGFDELLKRSDVLSLNLPLNDRTRNIISTPEFAKMKRGIVIVNTARGGVLDEAALVQAIDDGIVRSVGLDVYQQEPNIPPGLVSNPHVCLLPHMGTSALETKTQMEEWTISNVRSALETGKLRSIVAEQSQIANIHAH